MAAATSTADSTAIFDQRLESLGLTQNLRTALRSNGVTTMGAMAFAVTQPGTTPSDDEVRAFASSLIADRVLTIGELTTFKRLIFESHTITVVQLRAQHDPSSDPAGRKLPAGESTPYGPASTTGRS